MSYIFSLLNNNMVRVPTKSRSNGVLHDASVLNSTSEQWMKKYKDEKKIEFEVAAALLQLAYSKDVDDNADDDQLLQQKQSNKRMMRSKKRKNADEVVSKLDPVRPKKKKVEIPIVTEMPQNMRERIENMGGYNIELVIQKELQHTDLNKNQGRLALPRNKLIHSDFLTVEEENLLCEYDDAEKNKLKGLSVRIIDPLLRENEMCLKKWMIGSGLVYCFMTTWNLFVDQNLLKCGDNIQLWCFRFNNPSESSNLCFAFVKL